MSHRTPGQELRERLLRQLADGKPHPIGQLIGTSHYKSVQRQLEELINRGLVKHAGRGLYQSGASQEPEQGNAQGPRGRDIEADIVALLRERGPMPIEEIRDVLGVASARAFAAAVLSVTRQRLVERCKGNDTQFRIPGDTRERALSMSQCIGRAYRIDPSKGAFA